MPYKAAVGHNVALVSLVTLDPQPASAGIQATRRVEAISGKIREDALYVEFVYSALGDAAHYLNALTDFGLNDQEQENVTVYVRDDRWQWVRKNGIAKKPQMGKDARWSNSFPRNIVILVTDLEDPT